MKGIYRYLIFFIFFVGIFKTYGEDKILFSVNFDRGDLKQDYGEAEAEIKGDINYIDGIKGKGISLKGGSSLQYLIRNNISSETGTVIIWVKPITWEGKETGKHRVFLATESLSIYKYAGTEEIWVRFNFDGKTEYVRIPCSEWNKGEWYQIGVSWDKDVKVYINGFLVGSYNYLKGKQISMSTYLQIGDNSQDNSTGIDEICIYKEAINEEEIFNNWLKYQGDKKFNDDQLLAHICFEKDRKPERFYSGAVLYNPNSLTIEEGGCYIGKGYSAPMIRGVNWEGQEGTISFWMNMVDWDKDFKESLIIFRPYQVQGNGLLFYKFENTQDIYLLVTKPNPPHEILFIYDDFKNWEKGQWHNVVLTWKKDSFIKLYVDGKLTNKRDGSFPFPTSFKGIVFSNGILKNGWGCKKKTLIQDLYLYSRAISEGEIMSLANNLPGKKQETTSYSNILPISYIEKAPSIDGKIEEKEYSTKITGLINTGTHCLYSRAHWIYTGYDEKFLYIAGQIKLPEDYKLTSLSKSRDDSIQIDKGDMFVLFIRGDVDINSKTYKGWYITIAPNGNIYDSWEEISWSELSCNRYPEENLDLEVISKEDNGFWNIEVKIPLSQLKIAPNKFLISIDLKIGDEKFGLRDHPTWFDHYQAFNYALFTKVGVKFSPGDLIAGECLPEFLMKNLNPDTIEGKIEYKLYPFKVYTTFESMVEEHHIGEEVHIEVKGEPIFKFEKKFEVGGKEEKGITIDKGYFIGSPDKYFLISDIETKGEKLFSQVLPFTFYPPIEVSLTPIPSKEEIECKIITYRKLDKENNVKINFLDDKGKIKLKKEGMIKKGETIFSFSMGELPAGEYKVEVFLNNKIAYETQFKKLPEPLWIKEKKGIEALSSDWVPSGWVPIEVEKDKIKVWGRDYYIDKGGLINQIESQSHVLFSAPVKIKYIINGIENEISISEPKYILKDKGRVEFEQKGETSHFKLSTNQKIEFDGFDIVELKILPKNKFKIDKLYMQVNLTDEMKYLNFYGPFGKIEEMDIREGTTGLQISNDRVGLQWFTESYKGWMINSQKPRITIKKADKGWEVSFLFVNEPTEIESPMEIRFAFQSMPVKPYFKNWRDIRPQGWGFVGPPVNLVMTGEGQIWTTTSTCPYPRNWQVLDEMVKYVRQFNQKVYPYLNPFSIGLYQSVKKEAPFMLHHQWKKEYDIEQQNAPKIEEYFYYAADWNIKPPFIQESGRWKDERACCSPSSSFVDYFEYGVYDILTKTDLDGFYFDLAAPKINYDEEKGFSYYTKDGVLEGTDEIFAARNHFKRIYYLFDKYRGPDRKPYTLGHSSPESPYASFFDCCFCGEMIKPKKPYDWTHTYLQERIECRPIAPPPTGEINYELYPYRALFSPFYNMPIFYLPQYGYVKELGGMPELSRETLSITFLHNTILWPVYIPASPVYDFWRKVEIPFGMGDTTFYPYWENGTKTNHEFVKASYWKKENRDDYLVAVANWSDEDVVASIKLSEQLSKFESCMDMESGEKIKIENGLEIEIQKHNLRVFRFCASE